MKVRFPLYTKIVLWFFANLLLIGAVLYGLVRFQFRIGLDSLLAGYTADRIQAVAEAIRTDLTINDQRHWNQILQQFAKAYNVRFALIRGDTARIAGEQMQLPPAVLEKVRVRLPRKGEPPSVPADNRLNPFPDSEPPPGPPSGAGFDPAPPPPGGPGPQNGLPPPQNGPPWPPPSGPDMGSPARPGGSFPPGAPKGPVGAASQEWHPVSPRILLHTPVPNCYWILVHFPMQLESMPPQPVTLVAMLKPLGVYGSLVDFAVAAAVAGGALLLSALFWLPLVRGITRSISKMTHATAQIAEGQFDIRVPEKRRDEIGALGQGINRMAVRLAGLVKGQKRFLGDVAHELCSPLARTQMALGIMEQRASESDAPYLADLREEIQTMSSLVNELLSFSKASFGGVKIKLSSVHLLPIVERAISRESNGGAVIRSQVSGALYVLGEPELLLRSISNLIRNAVRYAGEAGPITISASRNPGEVMLLVEDCGPGIPDAALMQIFDPFYRADVSRSRETGGAGLGLAIVKTCIESCSGTVSCRNRTPSGLAVTITLKVATPPPKSEC